MTQTDKEKLEAIIEVIKVRDAEDQYELADTHEKLERNMMKKRNIIEEIKEILEVPDSIPDPPQGLTDEERQKEALRLVGKLAEMIRQDRKRKKILMGNYQSMIEYIKKILES